MLISVSSFCSRIRRDLASVTRGHKARAHSRVICSHQLFEFSQIRVRWNLDRNLMKTGLLPLVVMMASIGWSAVSVAQPLRKTEGLSKVSPELWKKTQEAGTLRVIVDLNVPGWTSKPATQQAELTQQQMISDTQEKVMRN